VRNLFVADGGRAGSRSCRQRSANRHAATRSPRRRSGTTVPCFRAEHEPA